MPDTNDSPELPDDATLLALISSADEGALSSLYERYSRLLYSVAHHITHDAEAAEEVLQDVFHAVWQRASQFRPSAGSAQSWLTAIARNRAIDEVRSRWYRTTSTQLSLDAFPNLPSAFARGWEQLAAARADLLEALKTLPPSQRQAIELSYFGGLTCQEIAQWFDEPIGTIKSRVRHGLEKLREATAGWGDPTWFSS
ncbi:MAG: sigma-70 family RNA polymerase sigma factor [Herpetosiphon sp.]